MAASAPLKDCTNDFAFDEADEDTHQTKQRRVSGASAGGKANAAAAWAGAAALALPQGVAGQGSDLAPLDPHRLLQRQKQIDYGKNTLGYEYYTKMVPRDKRRCKKGGGWVDPVTPDIDASNSKRCFDGLVKVWRKALHKYDEMAADKSADPLAAAGTPEEGERPKNSPLGRPTINPDAPPAADSVPLPLLSPVKGAATSPKLAAGSKRYFKDAFTKGSAGTPDAAEPSPKKSGGRRGTPTRSPSQHRRSHRLDPDNILEAILGDDGNPHSLDGLGVSIGNSSGYHLLADDAGASNASFCGKLGSLGVQL